MNTGKKGMKLYNIYCDESCHLEHDGNNLMVLGGILCPEDLKAKVFNDIRDIKKKHGLSSWFEIKWTKVSKSKVEFYIELIDYFFEIEELFFRGIVAMDKTKLDHDKYNDGDYDTWYYKMYFALLNPMIDPFGKYNIFIDIKDTRGGPKVKKLREVLCNNMYDFKGEVIQNISQIDSKESEILQLSDLLIGALSYYNRDIYLCEGSNEGKNRIIETLKEIHGINLSATTHKTESKFNIFVWRPRG